MEGRKLDGDGPPRLFPELWTRILTYACPDLAALIRLTALNREIRATCFTTPQSKCDFLLERTNGDVNQVLASLIKGHRMTDFVACLKILVRDHGAVHDCISEKRPSKKQRGKPCLLISLLERTDALDAVSACLNDEILSVGVFFSDEHRALAFWRAVDARDLAMMDVLKVSGSMWTASAPWWEIVVASSADASAAREMAVRLGLLPVDTMYVANVVKVDGLKACVRRGVGFGALAKEIIDGDVSEPTAHAIWKDVDLTDEAARMVIGTGVRPTSRVVWKYLMESRGGLPQRAADDAVLTILLDAGQFKPSTRRDAYMPSTDYGEHERFVQEILLRPHLMRDLVDAGLLVADYLDQEIYTLVAGSCWNAAGCFYIDAIALDYIRALALVDELVLAGGRISNECISALITSRQAVPDEFLTALIDRMPVDLPKSEDIVRDLIRFSYPRAVTRAGVLLARSFPVGLEALDEAVLAVELRTNKTMRNINQGVVDFVRELLGHADVPELVARDRRRAAGDARVIVKALEHPFDFNEEWRIYPVVKLLVDAGFEVKEDDVALASKGWVRILALFSEALCKKATIERSFR